MSAEMGLRKSEVKQGQLGQNGLMEASPAPLTPGRALYCSHMAQASWTQQQICLGGGLTWKLLRATYTWLQPSYGQWNISSRPSASITRDRLLRRLLERRGLWHQGASPQWAISLQLFLALGPTHPP